MAKRPANASARKAAAPHVDPPHVGHANVGSPAPTVLRAIAGNDTTPLSLDRLIHERVRLAIVSALAVHDTLTFNELKAMLEITDGNLSVHARKLEDARYIDCRKGYDGRIPRTEYRLTATGQQALETYLSHMEALIRRVGDGV